MPGLLWDHREAPADVDITDDEQLRKGLEYVYGSAAHGQSSTESLTSSTIPPNPRATTADTG